MIETREQALRRLGLKGDPGPDQVRKAYRKLALQHHPDLFSTPEERAVADEGFRRLGAAKDYLLDEFRVEEDIRQGEDAVPAYKKAGSRAAFDAEHRDIPRPARDFACRLRHAVWELRFKIYCALITVVAVWFFSWLFYFRFVYESPAPGSYIPPVGAEAE